MSDERADESAPEQSNPSADAPETPDTSDALDRELDDMAEAMVRKDGDNQEEPPQVNWLDRAKVVGGFVVLGLFATGGLFASQLFSSAPPAVAAETIGAKLELAAGEVTLVSGEGEGGGEHGSATKRLLSGTPLPIGATLKTGPGARALVRLADGSRIFIRDNSEVHLGEDTALELLAGELWLDAPPLEQGREPMSHRVGAATVVLTDGGANLALIEGGDATVYVAEGVATVASEAERKELSSGERALVPASGAKPEVEPVSFWEDWTGGMADRRSGGRIGGGAGALYAVDDAAPPGTPSLPLTIAQQTVDVAIEDNLAETRVDQRFFNPSDRDVEGWYWFTVPEGAMLVGFELETDGELIAGEIVERKQAAATYASAKVTNDNPALLEWIDERTVRAKIYPVPALGQRRIVVRYQQLLSESDGKLRYTYPLAAPDAREAVTIEEFALAVELRGDLARTHAISTLGEASVSGDNRLVTMRRSGFTPRADFELELASTHEHGGGHGEDEPALRLSAFSPGEDQARYVMLRWLPDIEFDKLPPPRADVVVVVDTSAFGDDAEHQSRLAVAEALLRSLSESDNFAVVSADLTAEVLYPEQGMTPASTENIDAALEALGERRHGGATDLGAIFERALDRVHDADQPAVVYIGDGLATSGERGSDDLSERLRRALSGSPARLFTVGVGPTIDDSLLERLARVGGGESLRVSTPDQAVVRALELSGAIKTPTLTDLRLTTTDGTALTQLLDDPFSNATGKLARGEELVLLARTHGELPEDLSVHYELAGEDHDVELPLVRTEGAIDFVVPKLWAQARIERLLGDGRGAQAVRGKVLALGLEYGLMTPFTSFLALDSEYAYTRKGIERRERAFDRQLLGAAMVLPHQQRMEDHRRPEPFGGASAGELLGAALTAPWGCVGAPADSGEFYEEEDVSASRTQMFGGGKDSADDAKKEESRPASDARMDDASAMGEPADAEPEMMEEEEEAPPPPSRPATAKSKRSSGSRAKGMAGGVPGGVPAPAAAPEPTSGEFGDFLADGEAAGLGGVGLIGSGGGGGKSGYGADNGLVEKLENTENKAMDAPAEVEQTVEGLLAQLEVAKTEGRDEANLQQGADADKDRSPAKKEAERQRESRRQDAWAWRAASLRTSAPTSSPVARNQKAPCSDASARPLSQRKVLWAQALDRAPDMVGRLSAYELAASTCELANWRQQRVFLDMLQAGVQTEAEIELLVSHFWTDVAAKAFLVRGLQRRLVDPELTRALERALFGDAIDLDRLELAVAAAPTNKQALELVEAALEVYRDVPAAERLHLDLIHIDLLFSLERREEAITAGRRLRERGLMTPALAERLGEILVAEGEVDEAKRIYSEIVEYDPQSPETRRLLGDIFLRHGWYQEAYRQFGDLFDLSGAPEDAVRLARAAAGAGRVDEGLRVLRQVAIGEGRPGLDDPRRWARMHAAFLLAQLHDEESDEAIKAKLGRELKRLQLFDAPTTWTFVVWRDLEHSLTLGPALAELGDDEAVAAARAAAEAASMLTRGYTLAGDTGLWAVQRGGLAALEVRHAGLIPDREVVFERVEVRWDGEAFHVVASEGQIAAAAARADEPEPEEPEPTDDAAG
ncbi:protein containing a von Willebrand factor type A domain [Plesiocystis pacifica SIR-1]|uniref:Protein containing a von Willebrand factor type A domain n=1 Tax=Plesiocystis pacifica SIR-1 TaxID=391625 RepID=A6G0N1_9BACT|nr:VIT domain-containing protein [Plesiocystis pacifica]EDM80677.1 protein containing a von Willebrand factor type A domain [Plesiocystis pacifica SIR-1]